MSRDVIDPINTVTSSLDRYFRENSLKYIGQDIGIRCTMYFTNLCSWTMGLSQVKDYVN